MLRLAKGLFFVEYEYDGSVHAAVPKTDLLYKKEQLSFNRSRKPSKNKDRIHRRVATHDPKVVVQVKKIKVVHWTQRFPMISSC